MYGYDGPAAPAWTKRLAVPDSETPARSKMAVNRLIARRDVHLREKTLRSKARRRGQAREDFVLETFYWDASTARLLPRLLKGRTRGPVFATTAAPARGRSSARDVCPDTGLARLSPARPAPC